MNRGLANITTEVTGPPPVTCTFRTRTDGGSGAPLCSLDDGMSDKCDNCGYLLAGGECDNGCNQVHDLPPAEYLLERLLSAAENAIKGIQYEHGQIAVDANFGHGVLCYALDA